MYCDLSAFQFPEDIFTLLNGIGRVEPFESQFPEFLFGKFKVDIADHSPEIKNNVPDGVRPGDLGA
jgi:hypothetical protein